MCPRAGVLARMDEGQVEALPAVAGREEAVRDDDGARRYWLHGVFIGSLWASGRLHPGGVDVARGWREQPDRDVAVWLRADNACCRERGRDCPVSLTDRRKRARMLLRAVPYQLLPARARRHGLRPLIRHLVRAVGRRVRSGRCRRLDRLCHAAVQREWQTPASVPPSPVRTGRPGAARPSAERQDMPAGR